MINDKYQRMPGEGFNARIAVPSPEPSARAKAADDAANATIQDSVLARPPLRQFPTSTGRQDTHPAFRHIAEGLDSSFTLSRLNDAVLMGQLTNAEANQIAKSLGLDKS